MKRSGNHKHDKDNSEGLHTHQYEELDDEGLKLIVKGKLKNLPNFSFKKPKTEKQKKEAEDKKEEKKKNKKEQLNELIDTIENNFSKFQSKKQIAQQTSNSSIPIPIYIPQYTQPTGKNLNIETLTEINDMILKKENELKQYYEREFKKSFSEVDRQYSQMETQTEPDDYEKKLNELNDYYNELLKYRDDLQKERDELTKKSNVSKKETDEYNRKLKELDDLYNKLLKDEAELKRERDELEKFRVEEERKAIGDTTSITLPDVPKTPVVPSLDLDVLELFGTPREEIETFDTPRGEIETFDTPRTDFPLPIPPSLPMPSIPQLTQGTEADEFIPPSEQPKLSEGFELVEFEEPELPTRRPLLPKQEEEEEPSRPITQDIVDLLDILDDTVISRFKQSQPYLQLEDRADRAEEERDKAQQQILELQNTMGDIEQNLLELGQEDIQMREADKAVIEEELRLKVQEAEDAKSQNERNLALKEAEILENKLQGAIQSKELRDELEKLKEQTKKELELKEQQIEELVETQQNMLLRGRDKDEDIPILQSKADIQNSDDYLYLKRLGVNDKFIPKRPKDFKKLLNEIKKLEDEEPNKLSGVIGTANSNAKNMTDFVNRIESRKIIRTKRFDEIEGFRIVSPEEQIRQEMEAEAREEELKEVEEQTKKELEEKIRKEKEAEEREEELTAILIKFEDDIEKQTRKVEKKEKEVNEVQTEINEISEELQGLNDTLRLQFESVGLNSLDDIEKIEDENDREEIKKSYIFINDFIQDLSNNLEQLNRQKDRKIRTLLRDKADLDELVDRYKARKELFEIGK
jgi:hypothetical protein